MTFTPKEIKELVEEYLRVLYPTVCDVEITLLIRDKKSDIWKVNVGYRKHYGDYATNALVKIETDGEVTEFKEGWSWRF